MLLQEVQKKVEDFRKGASVPIVVIANKSDLAHMRQVTHDEGRSLSVLTVHDLSSLLSFDNVVLVLFLLLFVLRVFYGFFFVFVFFLCIVAIQSNSYNCLK